MTRYILLVTLLLCTGCAEYRSKIRIPYFEDFSFFRKQSETAIEMVGPKEQLLGKNADYQIIITNKGENSLTDIVITDDVPREASIIAASGANFEDNRAIWKLKELKGGEKVSFNISTTASMEGCHTYRFYLDNAEGCCSSGEFTTHWEGKPALNVCLCDSNDPISVGETNVYTATIVNLGTGKDDNVKVIFRFPEEVKPFYAYGDCEGVIEENVVTFNHPNDFGPHQTIRCNVEARGIEPGVAKVIAEVSSSNQHTPILQQETTRLFFNES